MEHMAVFDTNILIDLFNNRVDRKRTRLNSSHSP